MINVLLQSVSTFFCSWFHLQRSNPGLAICRDYNISPEDLRWKLEAANFKISTTHSEIASVTLDTIVALKNQIQRDLTRERKVPPKSTVAVNTSRMRRNVLLPGTAPVAGTAAPTGKTVAQIKQENIHIAGPSQVLFSGPSQNEAVRKKRACEL